MSSSSRKRGGADQNLGSWVIGCPVQYVYVYITVYTQILEYNVLEYRQISKIVCIIFNFPSSRNRRARVNVNATMPKKAVLEKSNTRVVQLYTLECVLHTAVLLLKILVLVHK